MVSIDFIVRLFDGSESTRWTASASPFRRSFFMGGLRSLAVALDVWRRLEEHGAQRVDLAVGVVWLVDEFLDERSESLGIVASTFGRAARMGKAALEVGVLSIACSRLSQLFVR